MSRVKISEAAAKVASDRAAAVRQLRQVATTRQDQRTPEPAVQPSPRPPAMPRYDTGKAARPATQAALAGRDARIRAQAEEELRHQLQNQLIALLAGGYVAWGREPRPGTELALAAMRRTLFELARAQGISPERIDRTARRTAAESLGVAPDTLAPTRWLDTDRDGS